MDNLPEYALSINQPWAWLIVNGWKTVENRDWYTRFRGPVCIHAGKKLDRFAMEDVMLRAHPVTGERDQPWTPPKIFQTGGIIGVADITDCVSESTDPFFVGRFGFVLANAVPINLVPCKGQLGFFKPDYSSRYKERGQKTALRTVDMFAQETQAHG